MQIILTPFSWLLTVFYNLGHSYALALVLFAIVVKLILFPFSLKGKRGMIQMNLLNGKIQKIQKQYANNKVKANEEIQKLYAQEKVNPMSGCLWSFIPILILWPLYAIIRRPFFYMMGQTDASIQAISDALHFTASGSSAYNELKMAGMMTADNLQLVKDAANSVTEGLGDKIFHINFNFLGLDLSQIATWKLWEVKPLTWAAIGLFLLPVISAALGVVMSWISQKTNVMNKQQANQAAGKQMRTMMIISPLISLWIGFVMPAGLCIYWIINNVLQIASELVSGKILKKDYERAAAARAEQERLEKEEEKRKKQMIAERRAKAMEEAKKNKGKKKAPKLEKKKPSTNDAGRIGMRPYARGRCYDPDRYGGVTPYLDPGAPVDEEAVEAARQAREEAEAAARLEEEIEREVERELAGETAEETPEAAGDAEPEEEAGETETVEEETAETPEATEEAEEEENSEEDNEEDGE